MCREISLQSDNNVHCENLIRQALIRADETLSHFSPGWELLLPWLRLQSNCCCTLRLKIQLLPRSFFAQPHYFKEFLLYFGTLLLSSFAGATFCRGHVARSILQGGKKGRVARWQLAAVAEAEVAKAQKTTLASLNSGPACGQLQSHPTYTTQYLKDF